MKVRLTKKLAECIDGVCLTGRRVGDVLELPPPEARLLVAEQWAIPERRTLDRPPPSTDRRIASVAPPARRRTSRTRDGR